MGKFELYTRLLLDVIDEQMNVDGEKQTDAVKRAAVCRKCQMIPFCDTLT